MPFDSPLRCLRIVAIDHLLRQGRVFGSLRRQNKWHTARGCCAHIDDAADSCDATCGHFHYAPTGQRFAAGYILGCFCGARASSIYVVSCQASVYSWPLPFRAAACTAACHSTGQCVGLASERQSSARIIGTRPMLSAGGQTGQHMVVVSASRYQV